MRNSVMQYGAGQMVEFGILRQGQIVLIQVVIDPRPDAADPLVNTMQKIIDETTRCRWFASTHVALA